MQRRATNTGRSENHDDYHATFVRRVHQLIEAGYQRMRQEEPKKPFEFWAEEEISGELARHIERVRDELTQSWMRFFSLAPERHVDEPHLSEEKRRLGKRRKRLDFQFTCCQRKPVQRFISEAKSLKQSGAAQLLDEDGLGRILRGQYARGDSAAGLLGYVQLATVAAHATALESELTTQAANYGITTDGRWVRVTFAGGPANTFRTRHRRAKLADVTIFTTLLLFR